MKRVQRSKDMGTFDLVVQDSEDLGTLKPARASSAAFSTRNPVPKLSCRESNTVTGADVISLAAISATLTMALKELEM